MCADIKMPLVPYPVVASPCWNEGSGMTDCCGECWPRYCRWASELCWRHCWSTNDTPNVWSQACTHPCNTKRANNGKQVFRFLWLAISVVLPHDNFLVRYYKLLYELCYGKTPTFYDSMVSFFLFLLLLAHKCFSITLRVFFNLIGLPRHSIYKLSTHFRAIFVYVAYRTSPYRNWVFTTAVRM